jgi:hypothetical protein
MRRTVALANTPWWWRVYGLEDENLQKTIVDDARLHVVHQRLLEGIR